MNVMNFRNPFFYRTFLFLVLFELLSLFGYLVPSFNAIGFFVLTALVLALTIWRLEYGVYCILAELFIGSKGFLFYWEMYDTTIISLRIALWLIVITVWAVRQALTRDASFLRNFRQQTTLRWLLFFGIVLFAVTVHGIIRNTFANAFFDMNAWLFFLLIGPFLSVFGKQEALEKILHILYAAVLLTSIKALTVLFVYAHDPLGGVFLPLYRWIRNSGVGEVTAITPTFARVFFQSQMYTLIAFFSLFFLPQQKNKIDRVLRFTLHVLCFSSILLSFSRSFWLAGIVTLCSYYALLFIVERPPTRIFLKRAGEFFAIGVASFVLIWAVMNFPYPRTAGGSLASLVEDRATGMEEAGIGSRWSLLPPLVTEIKQHWFFGAGFGATVTYKSSDPRIVESSARGNNFYTTYAFEWGYLDLLLKFGLLGFAIYMILLWKIGKGLLNPPAGGSHYGLFLGFIALLVTNIFSPYLNHPLGIGYLLVCMSVIVCPIAKNMS